jgi:hypothetical protein
MADSNSLFSLYEELVQDHSSQWLRLPVDKLLEIHISDNDGRQDIHSRITDNTWWLSQITNFPKGIPLVLESRLNRLPVSVVQQEYDRIAALTFR